VRKARIVACDIDRDGGAGKKPPGQNPGRRPLHVRAVVRGLGRDGAQRVHIRTVARPQVEVVVRARSQDPRVVDREVA